MQVIVCSNNPGMADAVSRAIGDEGNRLTVCQSGLEALGAVGVLASDLVVLDLETPGISGLLLISAIKELVPELPIVAVSSKPEVDGRALSQKGVLYAILGSRPEGEASALLRELAREGRHETSSGSRVACPGGSAPPMPAASAVPEVALG